MTTMTRLTITTLLLICSMQFMLLYFANDALDMQMLYLRATSVESFRVACFENTIVKSNNICWAEAIEYTDKYLPLN